MTSTADNDETNTDDPLVIECEETSDKNRHQLTSDSQDDDERIAKDAVEIAYSKLQPLHGNDNINGGAVSLHQDNGGTGRTEYASLSSVDILRIKTKFLEIVEELRILRVSDADNERRIKMLLDEKHEFERKLEDAQSAMESKSEENTRGIAEVKKQLQEKLCKMESEKQQTTVKTDIWEKEVKSLKEELRTLLVTRYSLEKTVKEQEHRIQMQSSTSESHMSQMTDLEGRCKDVRNDCNRFREQLATLSDEVKAATDMNNKLSKVNTHQTCIIASLKETNARKQTEIVGIKSTIDGKQYEEQSSVTEMNSTMQRLKDDAASKDQVVQHLKQQVESYREEQQKTMLALSESHLLADRYLDNSLHSSKEVAILKKDLDKTKNDLDEAKKQLISKSKELEELIQEKEVTVAALQDKVTRQEKSLQELTSENQDLSNAFHNLEELNSSWSKKNSDLKDSVKALSTELLEKNSRLHEVKTQLADSLVRPEQVDMATSTMDFVICVHKETNTDEGAGELVSTTSGTLVNPDDDDDDVNAPRPNPSVVEVGPSPCQQVDSELGTGDGTKEGTNGSTTDVGTRQHNIIADTCVNVSSLVKLSGGIEGPDKTSHINVNHSLSASALGNTVDTPIILDCATPVTNTIEDPRVEEITSFDQPKEHQPMVPDKLHASSKITLFEVSKTITPTGSLKPRDTAPLPVKHHNESPNVAEPSTLVTAHPTSRENTTTVSHGNTFTTSAISTIVSPHVRPWIDSSQTTDDLNINVATAEATETDNSRRSLTGFPHLASMNLSSPRLISNPVPMLDDRQRENRFSFNLPPYASSVDKTSGIPASRHPIHTGLSTAPYSAPSNAPSTAPSTTPSAAQPAAYFGHVTSLNHPIKDNRGITSPPKLRDRLPLTALRYTTSWIAAAGDQQGVPKYVGDQQGLPKYLGNQQGVSKYAGDQQGIHKYVGDQPGIPKYENNQHGLLKSAGDQQGVSRSSKRDSQEQWPDFAEEFSAGSESQHSLTDTTATARQRTKRATEEPSLFSDDEQDADDDPKAGVASQIERIQVFLKKDRLKRQKKN